jgi:hypothetical protein
MDHLADRYHDEVAQIYAEQIKDTEDTSKEAFYRAAFEQTLMYSEGEDTVERKERAIKEAQRFDKKEAEAQETIKRLKEQNVNSKQSEAYKTYEYKTRKDTKADMIEGLEWIRDAWWVKEDERITAETSKTKIKVAHLLIN